MSIDFRYINICATALSLVTGMVLLVVFVLLPVTNVCSICRSLLFSPHRLNVSGAYDALLEYLNIAIRDGLVKAIYRHILLVSDDIATLFDMIELFVIGFLQPC